MPKPDRNTAEYAAYKAARRAQKLREENERDAMESLNVSPRNRSRSRSRGRYERHDSEDEEGSADESELSRNSGKRSHSRSPPTDLRGGEQTARSVGGVPHGALKPSTYGYGHSHSASAPSVTTKYNGQVTLPVGLAPPAGPSFTGSHPNSPLVAPYSGPPPIGTTYYPASGPGSNHSSPHPTVSAPPLPASYPGQGRPAVQTVFQYQTDGPNIGPRPYGGDPSPPPQLDPNHPGLMPGEGAGKVYPPGQAPQQWNNTDYYAQVLSDQATSSSLHHSIAVTSSSGVKINENGPGRLSGGSLGKKVSNKLGNLSIAGFSGSGSPSASSAHGTYANIQPATSASLTIPGYGNSMTVGASGGAFPPPSPALQPYHGTYQSISPMPSPNFNPSNGPPHSPPRFSASGSLSAGKHQVSGSFSLGPPAYPKPQHGHSASLGSLGAHSRPSYNGESSNPSYNPAVAPGQGQQSYNASIIPPPPSSAYSQPATVNPYHPPARSDSESEPEVEKKSKKPVVVYNPLPDAQRLLQELKHTFTRPQTEPLIDILPTLTMQQLSALKREYKKIYNSVNLAKHIKSVFTTSTPFGKLAFAVALGPYESEAWFANSWYQKKETRNELLIESLMGKSNIETAAIKAAFRDAKYGGSLEKAVAEELMADKFRLAVMTQLSCTKMEKDERVYLDNVARDVEKLYSLLERPSGGETEMIGIIVQRNDLALMEISLQYKQRFGRDLAKDIRKHSKNLAGETLLHVLAGALDKPLRDAKLLDQAITAAVEQGREDLLITRACRMHWELKHLNRVKRAFKKKFKISVGERILHATKGSYREFLLRMLRED
ncbi:hypothetical protein BZA77DRAFT_322953 [Pyronema omphalodes]|nr:hypothetical protein BZA77DRAFT_322953 [Pyronema omphalodes]